MTEGKLRQLGGNFIQVGLFLRKQFAPLGKHRFTPTLHIFEAEFNGFANVRERFFNRFSCE
jgi:hypothetical protein